MGQRIPCTSQMIDFEMNQHRQGYLQQEAPILVGAPASYSLPNFPTLVTSSGSTAYLDSHYLPEYYDSSMSYGMNRYNGVHQQCNSDLSFAAPGSFYYSYATPPSSIRLPGIPLNHAISEQLTSSSNYGVNPMGHSADNYRRLHTNYPDERGGSSKRKNAEGYFVNFPYPNGLAGSSSSVLHSEEVAVVDSASLSLPQYRGSLISGTDVGLQHSIRNGSGGITLDSIMVHDHNIHRIGETSLGQHLQPAGEGCASSWNPSSAQPYMHGSYSNGTSLETLTSGVHRYHETSFHHPPMNNWPPHNYHLSGSSPSMQGMRGHNINLHSQMPPSSYRFPLNESRSTINIPHNNSNNSEIGQRVLGPVPPTGFRLYRPHRTALVPGTTLRHQNLPHLRVLPADEVAILEIPEFYEVRNFVDRHRDLRLDIEDMSYEELLALGERIGSVNTGLSEEIITNQLKTKSYASSATLVTLEESPSVDKEVYSCIICQENYQNNEKIGVLNCGHEYHADCLKKWLLIKNVCPICKSEALAERKE